MKSTGEFHQYQYGRANVAPAWKVATLTLALACSHQALAQQPSTAEGASLEEIVVTAQRRSELSRDVPISITNIGADQLGEGDVQQLSDVMKLTPGLRFDNQGALSQPTIRGVGTAVSVSGGGSNVGIYVDGFYSPNPFFADFDLLNVESVQVLKGPQGTLFGRNSTGGAIQVSTTDPSSDFGAEVEMAYEKYNTQRYQAYATGGPSEALAFDVAAQVRKSDGFVDNIHTGSDDAAGYDNWSLRLGARLDMTDRTTAILRYTHTDTDDRTSVAANGFEENGRVYSTAAVVPGSIVATERDEISSDFQPEFLAEADIFQLTVKSELDNATLTSYTQYRRERTENLMDFDFSSLPIFHFRYDVNDDIFTQEFLLSSNTGGRLEWTTGLFFFLDDSDWEDIRSSFSGGPFVISGNAGSGTETRSVAAFGDATYQLTDNLFLTGGLRVSYDEVTDAYMLLGDGMGGANRFEVPDVEETNVSPRAVLRYTPTDRSSVYLSYTQGYKSPILNVGGSSTQGVDVDPEEITAYELGYKYASDRLTFDAAAFYYDYQDLQVATFDGPRSIIENAADSRVYGLEGQAQFAVTENFRVSAGAAWLDAEYEDFDRAQFWNQCLDPAACGQNFGSFIPSYIEAGGREMQRTPELTANIGASYTTGLADGVLDLSGTLYYTSDFYFDTSEQFEQDAYELLSLKAAWTDPSDTYTISLYGDNLTDAEYRSQVLPQQLGALSMWGTPRTYGASINVRFQ